jgi:hypothetical protein
MRACHAIIRLGGDPQGLPFCFSGGSFQTLNEFRALASSAKFIHLLLSKRFDENFEFIRIQELGTMFFAHTSLPEVIVLRLETSHSLFSKELAKTILEKGGADIAEDDLSSQFGLSETTLVIDELEAIWCDRPTLRVTRRQVFSDGLYLPPLPYWLLTLIRSEI